MRSTCWLRIGLMVVALAVALVVAHGAGGCRAGLQAGAEAESPDAPEDEPPATAHPRFPFGNGGGAVGQSQDYRVVQTLGDGMKGVRIGLSGGGSSP